jgi:hypothetical protein
MRGTDSHGSRESGGAEADPYGLDVPPGWTERVDGDRTTYESGDGDCRVVITEFSKGLSIYWWVDVFERDDGRTHREAGVGDTYTDPAAAAVAAQSYVDAVTGRTGQPDAASD